jgi:hypothetical protein
MNQVKTYEDLSLYGHMLDGFTLDDVICVGWIDVYGHFSTGDVPDELIDKLRKIACSVGPVKSLVEPVRISPTCPMCGSLSIRCGSSLLPEAEMWVPAGGRYFSSPIAIIHYVEVHKYLPPVEYLDAVRSFDLSTEFDADSVYRAKLDASEWRPTLIRP